VPIGVVASREVPLGTRKGDCPSDAIYFIYENYFNIMMWCARSRAAAIAGHFLQSWPMPTRRQKGRSFRPGLL